MTEIFGDVGIIVYPSKDNEIEFKKSAEVLIKRVKDKFRVVINTKSGFPKATITLNLDRNETRNMLKMLDSCLNNK